eukprot:883217-Prorocentrum_minimum.AAC.1
MKRWKQTGGCGGRQRTPSLQAEFSVLTHNKGASAGYGPRASGYGPRASGYGPRASGYGARASGYGARASGTTSVYYFELTAESVGKPVRSPPTPVDSPPGCPFYGKTK